MANREQDEAAKAEAAKAKKAAEAAVAANQATTQNPPTTVDLLARLMETPQAIQGSTSTPAQQ